jgi:hypothetical protein
MLVPNVQQKIRIFENPVYQFGINIINLDLDKSIVAKAF